MVGWELKWPALTVCTSFHPLSAAKLRENVRTFFSLKDHLLNHWSVLRMIRTLTVHSQIKINCHLWWSNNWIYDTNFASKLYNLQCSMFSRFPQSTDKWWYHGLSQHGDDTHPYWYAHIIVYSTLWLCTQSKSSCESQKRWNPLRSVVWPWYQGFRERRVENKELHQIALLTWMEPQPLDLLTPLTLFVLSTWFLGFHKVVQRTSWSFHCSVGAG